MKSEYSLSVFVFKVGYAFGKVSDRRGKSLSVCLSVCVSLGTIEVIIFKLVSDMVMHQVLIIWTLTFIQRHTYLNYENDKCSIISDTLQAIPIKFTVQIV